MLAVFGPCSASLGPARRPAAAGFPGYAWAARRPRGRLNTDRKLETELGTQGFGTKVFLLGISLFFSIEIFRVIFWIVWPPRAPGWPETDSPRKMKARSGVHTQVRALGTRFVAIFRF